MDTVPEYHAECKLKNACAANIACFFALSKIVAHNTVGSRLLVALSGRKNVYVATVMTGHTPCEEEMQLKLQLVDFE